MLSAIQSKLRSWSWRRYAIIFVAALVVLGVIGELVVGIVVREKLVAACRTGMNADLSTGFIWYLPPRGISVHNVRISRLQPDGSRQEVARASRVAIKLKEFPKHGRPLIVNWLQIDSPAYTVVAAQETRKKKEFPPPAATKAVASLPEPPGAPPRRSSKFEIRGLKITDGQVTFESPAQDAMVIEHINLAFSPAPGSSQIYRFSGNADDPASATLQGAGSIDVDDMTLGISELSMRAKIGGILSQTHLSQSARRRLEVARVNGVVDIHANASVPLNDWRHASYSATVQLTSGTGALPGSSLVIDSATGDFQIENNPETSAVHITLGRFIASSGASQLRIEGGEWSTLPDDDAWELTGLLGRLDLAGDVGALETSHLKGRFVFTGNADGPVDMPKDASVLSVVRHELIAYPRDVSVQPPKFPVPVDHINGGPITFRAGVIRMENLSANYGGDQALLDEAHITLDDPRQKIELQDLRQQIRIEGISGTLVCKQPGPLYPAALGKTIAQLRPSGPFAIGGGTWYAVNRKRPDEVAKPKPDYYFRVSTAGGNFALTPHKAPLTNIHGDATISPMLVDITSLRGNMFGGTVIAKTKITPIRPMRYEGDATFYNVNLETVTHDLALNFKKPLIGTMYLKAHAAGRGATPGQSPLQSLVANGELQIVRGSFGEIPTIRAAAEKVTKANQTLDGEAACLFSIKDEKFTLQNAAVGNPLFGLQGNGTVGFDKSLDLHAVAAPLGDWQMALRSTGVPVVNDIGGDIAGGIQHLFDGAQQTLLWDIHITGTTTHPKVEPIPAPIITRPVAAVFGQLMRGPKDNELVEGLRSK